MCMKKIASSTTAYKIREIFKIILAVEAEKMDSMDAIGKVEIILNKKLIKNK